MPAAVDIAERQRLAEDHARIRDWKRWGPYLSERQWGTVREDYSPDGSCWTYFPHDHARSRAYRWGEDGLLGICDRECRLCFALALWNGRDPILKERLFGLTGPEGNHGEDVKECYFYLDSTPTHSYMKALYKYPQAEFPYARLVEENRRRGRTEPEFELADTGVFDESRYFDVFAEYAKASPNDILIRVTVANRGPEAGDAAPAADAVVSQHVVLGLRRTRGTAAKPSLAADRRRRSRMRARDAWASGSCTPAPIAAGRAPSFCSPRTKRTPSGSTAFPTQAVTSRTRFTNTSCTGRRDAVNPAAGGHEGGGALRPRTCPAARPSKCELRLFAAEESPAQNRSGQSSTRSSSAGAGKRTSSTRSACRRGWRRTTSAASCARRMPGCCGPSSSTTTSCKTGSTAIRASRRRREARRQGRNSDWRHLFNRDVISMPDKWEYPWYAAWDLAFHMIPFARDRSASSPRSSSCCCCASGTCTRTGRSRPTSSRSRDVNPPVHAWACWRVYKMTGPRGARDRLFLARVFQKLLLNFTWWVNRKDADGQAPVLRRVPRAWTTSACSTARKPLPTGGYLEQADGTAWMAFYCVTMLAMALELASEDPAYEDIASKFFEHSSPSPTR